MLGASGSRGVAVELSQKDAESGAAVGVEAGVEAAAETEASGVSGALVQPARKIRRRAPARNPL